MRDHVKSVMCAVAAICLVYVGGAVLFSRVYPFRTYIDGKSVTFRSMDDVALDAMTDISTECLILNGRNNVNEAVFFPDAGISRKYYKDLSRMKPNGFEWPLSLFAKKEYTLDKTLEWNEKKLKACIDNLECVKNGTDEGTPASFTISDEGEIEVVPGKQGNILDKDKVYAAITQVLAKNETTVDLDASGCYTDSVTAGAGSVALKTAETAEEILNTPFTMEMGAGVTEEIPKAVLAQALSAEGDQLSLDRSIIDGYVKGLADEYDTLNSDRTFMAGDHAVTVHAKAGDTFYGWLMDRQKTVDRICDALANGGHSIEIPWVYQGYGHGEDNDFGGTYVAVDTDAQHMWVYYNGELLTETDVVTGMDTDGRRTDSGMYVTLNFNREYTMTGSYGNSFAHFFIGVTTTGIGIHDSSWRSTYGGTIYVGDGSHGCVNTPYDKMKTIFETLVPLADQRVPVVIYGTYPSQRG